MAIVELTSYQGTRIGSVLLDASVNESHALDAEVSEHPVEDGADITDQIRVNAKKLTIEGMISNGLLLFAGEMGRKVIVGSTSVLAGTGPESDRVEAAHTEIQRMISAREAITVSTTLAEYENMAIISYSVERNAALANCLSFTMELQEVLIRKGLSIEVPKPIINAKKQKVDKGKDAKTASTPPQEANVSIIKQAFAQ